MSETATQDDLVSLILRTTGGRRKELARAISSVVASSYRPIELVVVYQGTSADDLAAVRQLAESAGGLDASIIQNPRTDDRRAENLNIGWAAAKGRYVGFLDDDDTVRATHVTRLLSSLRAGTAAWTYGQTELVEEDEQLRPVVTSYPFYHARYSYAELLIQNFIPIHSFLLDRARLHPELTDRPFHEQLTRGEDWDFLVRLGYFHAPTVVDEVTCTYFASRAGRNVNVSLLKGAAEESKRHSWKRSEGLLAARRQELLSTGHRIAEYQQSLTILGRSGVGRRVFRTARLRLDRLFFQFRQRGQHGA